MEAQPSLHRIGDDAREGCRNGADGEQAAVIPPIRAGDATAG